MDKRQRYGDKLNKRIFLFKAKADKVMAETQMKYGKITESFQHKNDQARTKTQGLRTSGKRILKGIAEDADSIWMAVKKSFHHAASMFK
jgi:hypothetical protein